jgi:hypothetical protein
MSNLEKMILEEISTLEELRLIDVLGFIRYLKAEKSNKPQWIEGWFEEVAKSVRERAEELKITPAEIESQIKRQNKSSPNG